jgi:hypothetical protein
MIGLGSNHPHDSGSAEGPQWFAFRSASPRIFRFRRIAPLKGDRTNDRYRRDKRSIRAPIPEGRLRADRRRWINLITRIEATRQPLALCLFDRVLGLRAHHNGGTVRPSFLAVLRLTTRPNWVGYSIGRSAGLAPRRSCTSTRDMNCPKLIPP